MPLLPQQAIDLYFSSLSLSEAEKKGAEQIRKICLDYMEASHTEAAFLEQVINGAEYAIISVDNMGLITMFNKSAEKMTGYPAEEVVGKQRPIIFHDKAEISKAAKELSEELNITLPSEEIAFVIKTHFQPVHERNWTFIRKSGERITVSISMTALRNPAGDITGYLGIIKDITQQMILKENLLLAEHIIENSPSVLFKWLPDSSWSVTYVSENVKRLSGYLAEDYKKEPGLFSQNIHPEDIPQITQLTNDAVEKRKETVFLEYRIKHKDDHWIWVEEHSFIKYSPNGRVDFFQGMITDISERKKAQLKLEESELRYELVMRGTAAGLWDWINVEDTNQWWSPKFYEMLGYKDQEISADVRTFRSLIHPEDHPRISELLQAHFKDNVPYVAEYRVKTKSGDYKWILATGHAHRDETGKPVRMMGSIIDINNRKISEKRLQEGEDRFRILIESAKDIFYTANIRGNFMYVNNAAETVTGFSVEEILKMNYVDLIKPSYKESVSDFYRHQQITQKFFTYYEFPIIKKDGTEVWVGQNVQLLYKNGQRDGFQAVVREITEFKQAQLKLESYTNTLEKANKELDQFAYIVSHDLKAPLRGILNLAEWLKEDLSPHFNEETHAHFTLLKNRVHRMEMLINGILDYSKVGRKKYGNETFRIVPFIEELFDALNMPQHFKKNVVSSINNINTDKISMERVLSNLISNVIKYNNNPNPTIDISVSKQGPLLFFCVKDNGAGIDPAYHDKIFQIFQTLQARDEYESTGIGLSIVKKILEERGGTIWVQSQPGEGAAFYFTWPLNEEKQDYTAGKKRAEDV